MITVKNPCELESYEGQILGTTEWIEVTQQLIDDFAKVSGDHNWIHVGVERARKELSGGKTIAHGMLTLSLMTGMSSKIVNVAHRGRGINYGFNKVRFTAPVPVDSFIRLERSLKKFEKIEDGVRLTYSNVMRIKGQDAPVMVAESLAIMYEEFK